MNDARFNLESYLGRRLNSFGIGLSDKTQGTTLLRSLTASILPPVDQSLWVRRPSISDNGEPVVVSFKATRKAEQAVRILVECGSLRMTVAQQVAYSLTLLDDILGELGWRDVTDVLNSITTEIFPLNPSDTSLWRGGIWLGAEYTFSPSKVELRIYFNLRHGNAAERWSRLTTIISSFASQSINPFLDEWRKRCSLLAVPVGLGVVVSNNKVSGIRAYLGVDIPNIETVSTLAGPISNDTRGVIAHMFNSYNVQFGQISRQGVTMGYDFLPQCSDVSRVKVDLCCNLIDAGYSLQMFNWIKTLLSEMSFQEEGLTEFLYDINTFWRTSTVQFLSLGFAPELQHATIYVQTGP